MSNKKFELEMVIKKLSEALKEMEAITQEIKKNQFAEYTIDTPYYKGIIQIKENKEEK